MIKTNELWLSAAFFFFFPFFFLLLLFLRPKMQTKTHRDLKGFLFPTMCFPSLEAHKTTARSQLNLPERVF